MENCPACHARYVEGRLCHRCKADIGKLIDIECEADSLYNQSVAAYLKCDYTSMLNHARRSCFLRRTPEAVWLMACAACLTRQFDLSLHLWKTLYPVSSVTYSVSHAEN